MKVLDRLDLVDRIGRELQSRMTYAEINTYLKAYGINIKKPTSGTNSKWVYSKEMLTDEPENTILRIADELNVSHNYTIAEPIKNLEATFWEPFHFKLFISHLSTFKATTSHLQIALRQYGISAFVAHVDIEPTKEWQEEIEAGLYSMDALAAILMPGFKESSWTDQEVGFAIGRGVLIIPIMKGINPYGFISKYQGLNAKGKTVSVVADDIFRILVNSPKTRTRMLSCLTETTLQSLSAGEALVKLEHLNSIKNLPITHIERLRDAAQLSKTLATGKPLNRLNDLLAKHKLKSVSLVKNNNPFDDDVPF